MRFDVPHDWKAIGGESTRYRLGMVFCLPPSGQREDFPDSASPMIIAGGRISGAPVMRIPRDREQGFHGIVNTDSTAT